MHIHHALASAAPASIAVAVLLLISACTSTTQVVGVAPTPTVAASTIPAPPEPTVAASSEPHEGPVVPLVLTNDDFAATGGCSRTVHAANADWSEVIEVSIAQITSLVPGEATVFSVGDGVSVQLVKGQKMANLYCNDFLEGGERRDETHSAFSGDVTVTLHDPLPEEFGSWSDGAEVTVELDEVLFPISRDVPTVYQIVIEARVGWVPG